MRIVFSVLILMFAGQALAGPLSDTLAVGAAIAASAAMDEPETPPLRITAASLRNGVATLTLDGIDIPGGPATIGLRARCTNSVGATEEGGNWLWPAPAVELAGLAGGMPWRCVAWREMASEPSAPFLVVDQSPPAAPAGLVMPTGDGGIKILVLETSADGYRANCVPAAGGAGRTVKGTGPALMLPRLGLGTWRCSVAAESTAGVSPWTDLGVIQIGPGGA